MNKITRRALARGGAAGLAGALAAPALAQSDKRRWRMVTSWPKRLPGPGMSAERVAVAHRHALRRPARDHGVGRGRNRAGIRGARCCRLRRRRDGTYRRVLLAGQGAGRGVLHHGAVRAYAERACGLDRRRRRPGVVGRHLRAVRRQAVHGRQYRRVHGRLVPPRDQKSRRRARPENPLARLGRRSLSPARRHPADHLARRNPGGAAIGRARCRRIRRPRLRHRARALSLRAVLLRPRLQQAERHRRVHRRAQGLGEPRCRDCKRSWRMPAPPKPPSRSPRWSGSTSRRSTR